MSKGMKKLKRKINIIDVVIILLILALIATCIYKINSELNSNTLGKKHSNYVLKFECEGEYNSILKYLKNSDTVYFASDGTVLGYIYDPNTSDDLDPVYEIISSGEGAQEKNESVDKDFTYYEKVKIGGEMRLGVNAVKAREGGHYIVEGKNLTIGGTFDVYTENAVFTLKIISIDIFE